MRDLNYELNQQLNQNQMSQKLLLRMKLIMKRAKRSGYWYRLSKMERSLFELCIRLKVKMKGMEIIKAVVSVMKKVVSTGKNELACFLRGVRLAWLYSKTAVSWGYKEAEAWRNDISYVSFLGRLSVSVWGVRY